MDVIVKTQDVELPANLILYAPPAVNIVPAFSDPTTL